MRNFNYIPVINDNGMIEFIGQESIKTTPGLIYICNEAEIQYGPEYFYNQYKEKYA